MLSFYLFSFNFSFIFLSAKINLSTSNFSDYLEICLMTFSRLSLFSTAYFFNWQLSLFINCYFLLRLWIAFLRRFYCFNLVTLSSWICRYLWSISILSIKYLYWIFLLSMFSTNSFSYICASICLMAYLFIFLLIRSNNFLSYSSSIINCFSGFPIIQY